MKAEMKCWTDHQSGAITLTGKDGEEIDVMRIIALCNVPDVSKFNQRLKAVAESVTESINGYEGELTIDG